MSRPPIRARNAASVVFGLPGSRLEILWIRGGRLFIGTPREPGGAVTPIDHPAADASYRTERAAGDAVAAFIAAASADGAEAHRKT